MATQDPLETDWIHDVFDVLREELVAISDDFGDRVKHEVDVVAASQTIRPPSAVALLTAVAVETGNFAGSLLQRAPLHPTRPDQPRPDQPRPDQPPPSDDDRDPDNEDT